MPAVKRQSSVRRLPQYSYVSSPARVTKKQQEELTKKQQEELMRSFQRGVYVALAILTILTLAYFFYLWYSHEGVPVDTKAKQEVKAQQQKQAMQPGNMQSSQWNANDTANVVRDGLGVTGAWVVQWLDMVVVLIVLGFIIGVFAKMSEMFK